MYILLLICKYINIYMYNQQHASIGGGLDNEQSTNQLNNAGSQYLFNSDSTFQLNSNNPSKKNNINNQPQSIGLNILVHNKLAGSAQVIY